MVVALWPLVAVFLPLIWVAHQVNLLGIKMRRRK